MRIIEPQTFRAASKQKQHKKRVRILTFVGILLLVIVPIGIKQNKASAPNATQEAVSDEAAATGSVAGTKVTKNSLKTFSSEDFQRTYESLAMPNTELISTPPIITGDEMADKRIRSIAENRGYKLRSVPVLPIVKTKVEGLIEDDLLQPKAYESWLKLQKAAKNDNIPLKLNSGYRSIEWQRSYFVQILQARGISVSAIASGSADAAVSSVMDVVAPPGYSRHHTGYTIDLICQDGSGKAFEFTTCFNWLKKDNYSQAKKAGWIPSYPEGTSKQGPEPESWEYVWVDTDVTYE